MINIDKAIYCWDPETGRAAVTQWPMRTNLYPDWLTFGACDFFFQRLGTEQQKSRLLVEAWQSVVFDGIDPKEAHRALLQVEGMADLFAPDCLSITAD